MASMSRMRVSFVASIEPSPESLMSSSSDPDEYVRACPGPRDMVLAPPAVRGAGSRGTAGPA